MNFFKQAMKAAWLYICGMSLIIISVVVLLYTLQPPLLARLDLKVYDMMLPLRAASYPSIVPIIIDIDEKSLERYGQWPWPRYIVADLLKALQKNEVAAVGLDIIFSEADNSSPVQIENYIKKHRAIDVKFTGLPEDFYDYDVLFSHVLKSSPSVLGFYVSFSGEMGDSPLPASINFVERTTAGSISYKTNLQTAAKAVMPLAVLSQNAPVAYVNIAPDEDGLVRKIPILLKVKDQVYPTLSLRSLMVALGVRNLIVNTGPDGLESVRVGKMTIPVSPQGTMHIPFIGPSRTYPYISASDVLDGKVTKEQLAGRIAFVGTSAAGLLDIRAMPFDSVYPGVEIHAAALDTFLMANAITIPKFTPALQVLGIVLSGLIATVAFGFAHPRIYVPTAAVLISMAIMISRYFFTDGMFLSPLYVVLTVVFLAVALLLLRFWQEEKQKKVLRNAFSKYVSPEIVKRITNLQGDFFAGEERELSILFTDIRGFTSISERLSPNQIVELLNRYFTPMTAIVRDSEGTLDKFIGDALMAFWNAPLEVADHAVKAVDGAIEMQSKLFALREELKNDFGVELYIGAGINTGSVYVGNMGSQDLVNYTLIGDNVNLAARLEGLSSEYGVPVVISETTKDSCGDAYSYQYIDKIRAKGKTQPVRIFMPLRPAEAEARREELERWENTCSLYLAGDFQGAKKALLVLNEDFPNKKLYSLYLERAIQLEKEPPAEWDGIWTWLSK